MHEQKQAKQIAAMNATQVALTFTRKDTQTGMKKLRTAALHFNDSNSNSNNHNNNNSSNNHNNDNRSNNSGNQNCLSTLRESSALLPHELKGLLQRVFRISLTASEAAAVFAVFDKDNSGTVNGSEFLSCFFRMRHKAQTRQTLQRKQLTQQQQRQHEQQEQQLRQQLRQNSKVKVSASFTASDVKSALAKLETAARVYAPRCALFLSLSVKFKVKIQIHTQMRIHTQIQMLMESHCASVISLCLIVFASS